MCQLLPSYNDILKVLLENVYKFFSKASIEKGAFVLMRPKFYSAPKKSETKKNSQKNRIE